MVPQFSGSNSLFLFNNIFRLTDDLTFVNQPEFQYPGACSYHLSLSLPTYFSLPIQPTPRQAYRVLTYA
jgi:hypothetical protein